MSLRPLRLSRLALPLLLATLAACSVLPEAEALRVFLLPSTPPAAVEPAGARSDKALRISTPQASRVLASDRIAVVPQGNQISAYQGARWSDAATALLRDRLIEAFQQDGRLPSVSSEDANLPVDLVLYSDLRAFQSEYRDGQPHAVIRLDARLVDRHTQRTLASRRFAVSQASDGTAVERVVEAFGRAGDTLSGELLRWTLEQAKPLAAQ
jgi:cholesterol transport system auxiliary component